MDSNQVPLRGRAVEKERYILTKEDIDKVVRMVMEEGFSMEYAVKMALKCTTNTFRKKVSRKIPRAIRRSQEEKPVQRQGELHKGMGWMGQDGVHQLLVA